MEKKAELVLKEIEHVLDELSEDKLKEASKLIQNANKVFVLGLGRAGFSIKSLGMRLMHLGFESFAIGETITPDFESNDLLIVASGSGKTEELIHKAKNAKKIGGKVLLLTATENTPLTQTADLVIVIDAPSKASNESDFASIQPMASLYEQGLLIVGDTIVLELMNEIDKNGDEMFKRHSNLE